MISGAQAAIDCLVREDVSHVFGIPGTQNLPLIDALRDTPQLRFVLTRHEQGAAFMAYGFARASGRPAVVTATEGPGVTNLATGIAAAFKAYVPVIGLNGTQEHWLRERDASQDIDQVAFFRPITKWAYQISSATKVQEAIRKAFRVALSDAPGPVHLDAPKDVWLAETEPEPLPPSAYRATLRPECPAAALDQAITLLREAERPVLVLGSGVIEEDATEAIVEFAEESGIPVAVLQSAVDAFPTTHPLALGTLGRNGWSSANAIAPQSDLVFAIGGRLDLFSTLFTYGVLNPNARLIHQGLAPRHLGVVFPVALAVTGSTRSFVTGLQTRLGRTGQRWSWADVAGHRAQWAALRDTQLSESSDTIVPAFVAHLVRRVLPTDGILVLDAGNAIKHLRVHFDVHVPRTFLYTDDWGSVGCALPVGLGARLAQPHRTVVCAMGDMGMMCNVGELETSVREHIPVVCVVLNDQGLGNERAWQRELYGSRYFGVDYQNPDFGALARAFGAFGEQVTRPTQLEEVLRRAVASGRPAVVDVLIDKDTLAPVALRT